MSANERAPAVRAVAGLRNQRGTSEPTPRAVTCASCKVIFLQRSKRHTVCPACFRAGVRVASDFLFGKGARP
jgi:hypothetical protein